VSARTKESRAERRRNDYEPICNDRTDCRSLAAPQGQIAGLFYLLTFLTGAISSFVGGRLVVSGDAAITANNILAHQPLFRLGFAADVSAAACYVVVTALFYDLFKPVNRSLSLLAAFIGLVGCAI